MSNGPNRFSANLPGRISPVLADIPAAAAIAGRNLIPNIPVNVFTPTRPVVIDVGAKIEAPQVIRDGFEVPSIGFDADRFDDFIGRQPVFRTRVIKQSIPAGTPIRVGTTIDLVTTSGLGIPGGVFAGGHLAFDQKTLGEINEEILAPNAPIRDLLIRKANLDDLDDDDRQTLRVALGDNVEIDESDPKRSLGAAFLSLRTAFAFTGGDE
ncbi:MAG: PASTA domain-containing protein [Acidobacteriota bacterium]